MNVHYVRQKVAALRFSIASEMRERSQKKVEPSTLYGERNSGVSSCSDDVMPEPTVDLSDVGSASGNA
jgi:hypothetical protein